VDFDFEITQLTVRRLADGKIVTCFSPPPIGHRK